MKLTQRGRDYLKATIALVLVSSVFDLKSLIALSFTLALAALISSAVLASVSTQTTKVTVEPKRMRGFKGEDFPVSISMIFKRRRWITVHLSSIRLPEGVLVKSQEVGEGSIKLRVKSPYAGLFYNVGLKLELRDTLGLFSREFGSLESPFEIESLPRSLLALVPAVRPLPLSIGDRSARAHGSSLELYSLDEYQPFNDTKNLLWKKIARMPDERLIVRVREAMIPKLARIGLVESVPREKETKLRFIDLFCEGLGLMCDNFFAAGASVEILSATNSVERIQSFTVSNIAELTDALIATLGRKVDLQDGDALTEVIDRSDIVISGLLELEDERLAGAISKKLALLIEEEAQPSTLGEDAIVFSGTENVRKLVSKVLER